MEFAAIEHMNKTMTYKQIIEKLDLDCTVSALISRMATWRRGGMSKVPASSVMSAQWMSEHAHMTAPDVIREFGFSYQSVQRAEYRTGIKLKEAAGMRVFSHKELEPNEYPAYARIPEIRGIVCGRWV